MTDDHRYSLATARAAAERDELDAWVAEFLASPGSDNADLAAILTSEPRWWLGPVELPIAELNRLAGPAGDPVVVEVDEEEWGDDVADLGEKVEEGWEPPPVVVTFRDGQLVLEDGNHRVEGLRRAGEETAWAVVGFDDPEERARFTAPPT
jgi:hypothetical protein